MGLNPGVGGIVHEVQESWNDPIVELLLEDGGEVCRHLTEGVATSKPDSRMLWKEHVVSKERYNATERHSQES